MYLSTASASAKSKVEAVTIAGPGVETGRNIVDAVTPVVVVAITMKIGKPDTRELIVWFPRSSKLSLERELAL